MKFNIAKSDLTEALAIVAKGMSARSTLAILSGILVEAENDGTVVLQTTDLEISIRHTVHADVVEPGKTVVPGKLFSDIVKTLPDAAIGISTQAEQTHVDCMGSSFTLSSLNPADFPYFPQVNADTTVKMEPAALEHAVRKVVRAVSRDESRAILTGILFSVENDAVRLVATDSYRLALADVKLEDPDAVQEFQAIIPGKTFEDVARLAAGQKVISIGFSDNQVLFEFGTTTFVSRKIEGTFPNYKQLIPDTHEVAVQVPVSELVSAIKRVALLVQSHSPIRFEFDADSQQATISARTQDVGQATETIDAAVDGGNMQIAFNHQYILDGLSAIDGDVVIELQTSLKPGILKGAADESFLYLAMPVRLS